MECAQQATDIKQEAEVVCSNQAESLPMRRSAPVTTGHGGGLLSGGGGWMQAGLAKQFSAGRLGNNRPPIPTCSIPATRTNTAITMVPIESSCMQQASSSKLADGLLGFSGPTVKVENPQSASGSGDSTQDQGYEVPASSLQSEEGSQPNSEDESGSEDDLDDRHSEHTLRRSARQQTKSPFRSFRKGKERKKVGRPIAYHGDPDSPELTEAERRRIKRRIANRESARRVRHKRQEELEELQAKMEVMQAQNLQLVQHAHDWEAQRAAIVAQLMEMEAKVREGTSQNASLRQENAALRNTLQMKMSVLEEELDRRAGEPVASQQEQKPVPSAFVYEAAQQAAFEQEAEEQAYNSQFSMGGKPSLDVKMAMELFPSLNLDEIPFNGTRAGSLDFLNTMFQQGEVNQAPGLHR